MSLELLDRDLLIQLLRAKYEAPGVERSAFLLGGQVLEMVFAYGYEFTFVCIILTLVDEYHIGPPVSVLSICRQLTIIT